MVGVVVVVTAHVKMEVPFAKKSELFRNFFSTGVCLNITLPAGFGSCQEFFLIFAFPVLSIDLEKKKKERLLKPLSDRGHATAIFGLLNTCSQKRSCYAGTVRAQLGVPGFPICYL